MARNVDYSRQVQDIAPPITDRREASLLLSAARTQANAILQAGQSSANAITALGTEARAANLGYKEAGAESEIKAILDQQEGFGAGAIAAQKRMDERAYAQSIYDNPLNETPSEDIRAFQIETGRILDAESQGIFSRQSTITRVGEVVKRFSADMPGQASAFRRLGAELTGINNLDTYGVHNALTTASGREKQAQKLQEEEAKFDRDVRAWAGYSPTEPVPGNIREVYRQSVGFKNAYENAKNKIGATTLVGEEADKAWEQVHGLKMGERAAGLNGLYLQQGDAQERGDVKRVAELGLAIERSLTNGTLAIQRELNESASANATGAPTMSAQARERVLGRWDKQVSTLRDASKSVEGRDLIQVLVKNRQGNVALAAADFDLMHPHFNNIARHGGGNFLFKEWFTLGANKAAFEKVYPGLGDMMESVVRGSSPQAAAIDSRVASGQQVDFGAMAQTDPALAAVGVRERVESARRAPTAASTPLQIETWVNGVAQLGYVGPSGRPTLNVAVRQDVDSLARVFNSPDVQRGLTALTPEQRARAVAPIAERIVQVLPRQEAELTKELAALNAGPAAEQGWTFKLERDGISGAQRLTHTLDPVKYKAFTDKQQRLGVSFPTPYDVAAQLPGNVSSDVGASVAKASTLVSTNNTLRQTYNSSIKPHIDSAATALRGSAGAPAAQPRAATSGASTDVTPRMVTALGKAESNGNPNAVGDGGKAIGPHQMHPDAARESGISPEERSDPVKSAAAAKVYLTKQLQAHGGDINKAIASWNMGPAGFAAHLKKHGDNWQLELPDATRGLIRRYHAALRVA